MNAFWHLVLEMKVFNNWQSMYTVVKNMCSMGGIPLLSHNGNLKIGSCGVQL